MNQISIKQPSVTALYHVLHLFILCFCIFFDSPVFGNGKDKFTISIGDKERSQIIFNTLEYLMIQDDLLKKIYKKYPEFSLEAKYAKINFDMAFGEAYKNLHIDLKKILGKNYKEVMKKVQQKIPEPLKMQDITPEFAQQYITEIQHRSKGNIASPFLESLLHYQFKNMPMEEFSKGFTERFSSKNHPKSQNYNVSISYPKSWHSEEGLNPHVIQKFYSHDRRMSFLILIRPILKQENISSSDLSEQVHKDNLINLIPHDAKFISSNSMLISNYNAGEIRFEQSLNIHEEISKRTGLKNETSVYKPERVKSPVRLYHRQYHIPLHNKYLLIEFSCNNLESLNNSEFDDYIDRADVLFALMLNSVVIENQYTDFNYSQ